MNDLLEISCLQNYIGTDKDAFRFTFEQLLSPECAKKHYKAVKEQSWKIILLKDVLGSTLTLEKRAKTLSSWLRADETNSRRKKKIYLKEAFYILISVGIVIQPYI